MKTFFKPTVWKILSMALLLYPFLVLCNYVGVILIVLAFQWAIQNNYNRGNGLIDFPIASSLEYIVSAALAYLLSCTLITIFGKKSLERRFVLYILVVLNIFIVLLMFQWYTSFDFRKAGVPNGF